MDVATISASLKTETWTLTAVSPTSFTVSASRSGAQGTATVGTAFNANNGAVSFTIPAGANPYITGDRFEFETFVGDGWREATTWVNPGLSGAGDIVISLPAAVQARYVSLQFVKAVGAPAFTLDEIAVQDDSGANVSQGKLYLLGGYHQTVVEPDDNVPPQSAASLSPDPGTGWASQAVTVTLASVDNDGGSGVRDLFYSLDGFTTSLPYTQPFTLGEGTRTVQFYAVDNAGNAEAVRSVTVRVDLTPPTGTLVINAGAQYATSSTVNLTLTGSDALSGVAQMRFSVDGVNWSVPQSFSASRTWTLADGEGFRTAYVRFQDTAGNWSTGQISDGIVVTRRRRPCRLESLRPLRLPVRCPSPGMPPRMPSECRSTRCTAMGNFWAVSRPEVTRTPQPPPVRRTLTPLRRLTRLATFQPQVLPPQSRLRGAIPLLRRPWPPYPLTRGRDG